MKTDDLVAFLSTNPEPVDRGLVVRTLLVALGAGSTPPWGSRSSLGSVRTS
jgi:hypothetical protein